MGSLKFPFLSLFRVLLTFALLLQRGFGRILEREANGLIPGEVLSFRICPRPPIIIIFLLLLCGGREGFARVTDCNSFCSAVCWLPIRAAGWRGWLPHTNSSQTLVPLLLDW